MRNSIAIPTIVSVVREATAVTGAVNSVNGRDGDVVLSKVDVNLGNVDNTADLDKPISTATQAELDKLVTLATDQTITGNKNFTTGVTVSGKKVLNVTETDNLSVGSSDYDLDIFSKTTPLIVRGNTSYENTDAGNFDAHLEDHVDNKTITISNDGKLTAVAEVVDHNGIKGDYATHYGIINCQRGLITDTTGSRRVVVQGGMQFLMPGTTAANEDVITQLAADLPYDIVNDTNVTLFIADGDILESDHVYYQIDEPEINDTLNSGVYAAWYNPQVGVWQFKSDDTGNIWREAKATPIADVCIKDNNITRIDYIGYRVLNKIIFQEKLIAGSGIVLTDNGDYTTTISATYSYATSEVPGIVEVATDEEANGGIAGKCITADQLQTAKNEAINTAIDSLEQTIDDKANTIDVQVALDKKQNKLVAGEGVLLTNNTDDTTEIAMHIPAFIKADLPDPLTHSGTLAFCTDINTLVFCDGLSWKQVNLSDLN